MSFLRAPLGAGDAQSYRYIEDGVVFIKDGRIEAVGPASEMLHRMPSATPTEHYPEALILPGFIDPHIHYPQTQVIASYGAQLLEWLEKFTFVEEQKFADPKHAAREAEFFLDELARNGTTTACAYCSAHPASAEALFSAAHRRNVAMVAGNAIMNRNGPPALLAGARDAIAASRDLIRRWHGTGRQRYAVTPRFAITSTDEQLAAAGDLLAEFPTVLMQTHLDENKKEIVTVERLFPNDVSYAAVYERFGLLGPRSLLGHCIHLGDDEVALLRDTHSVAVFCPTSNLFIGSGLFGYERLAKAGVRIALATDVGGGTSYSMLRTAAEAYKVLQLQGENLPALVAFDLITRANAAAIGLDAEIGTITPGAFADLVVLDSRATPAMAHRMEVTRDLEEELFVLMTMGDDRAVLQTYIAGKPALEGRSGTVQSRRVASMTSGERSDETFLRRAFAVAARAHAHGNHPFGAILVDSIGNVLFEVENGFMADRDSTAHAERLLATQASKAYDPKFLAQCTLYTSAEPCAMCSGAIYWAGIGRVVFGLTERQLKSITGDHPENPTMDLPCRTVLGAGQRFVEVVGPLLEDEAAALHAGVWQSVRQ